MRPSRALLAALVVVGGCGGASTPGSGPGPGTAWSFDSGPPIPVVVVGATGQTLVALEVADHDDDGTQDLGAVVTTPQLNLYAFTAMRGVGDGTFGDAYAAILHVSGAPPFLGRGEVMGPGQEGFVLGTLAALDATHGILFGGIRTIGHRTTAGDTVEVGGSDVQQAGIVGIAAGDWNGDGNADVALGDAQGTQVLTWLSIGESGLGPVVPRDVAQSHSPVGIAAADWQGDGTDDLFVSFGDTGYQTFVGPSAGVAVPWPTNDVTFLEPVTGDFDGDLKSDVAGVVFQNGQVKLGLLRGNGDGTFQPLLTTTPTDVTLNLSDYPHLHAADLDGDGRTDLILRIPGGDQTCVFLGTAAGTFSFFPDPDLVGGVNDLLAVGDVDGDGDQDLVIGSTAGMTVRVLLSNRIQPGP